MDNCLNWDYVPSKEFLNIKKRIIEWNRQLKIYQGESYDINEVRKNALTAALTIKDNIPGKQINISGSVLEWVENCDPDTNIDILYIHGGGFITGSLDNHRPFAKILSKQLNARILMAGYPLSPENRFPEALNSCTTIWKYMDDNCSSSSFKGILGDSAGANLALASIMKLNNDKYKNLPFFGIFLSGFFDLSFNQSDIYEKKDDDIVLQPQLLKLSVDSYASGMDLKNPYISPVYGDFDFSVNLFFQVGTDEILFNDSKRCFERAKSFNASCDISVWPGMIHSFQSYFECMPESYFALKEIKLFIDQLISKPY
jgi:acetyl esterase/lipase